jgi:hypothetical protein
MLVYISQSIFITLTLVSFGFAAIGPIADLDIANAVISPDGFNRSYVICRISLLHFMTVALELCWQTANFRAP